MSITLTPSDYQCPEHHVDLTALVRQQLEQEDIPVASYAVPTMLVLADGEHGSAPLRLSSTAPGTTQKSRTMSSAPGHFWSLSHGCEYVDRACNEALARCRF